MGGNWLNFSRWLNDFKNILPQEKQIVEDGLALESFPSNSCKHESSDDVLTDSNVATEGYRRGRSATAQKPPLVQSKLVAVSITGRLKQETKQRILQHSWPRRRVCLFPYIVDLKYNLVT